MLNVTFSALSLSTRVAGEFSTIIEEADYRLDHLLIADTQISDVCDDNSQVKVSLYLESPVSEEEASSTIVTGYTKNKRPRISQQSNPRYNIPLDDQVRRQYVAGVRKIKWYPMIMD